MIAPGASTMDLDLRASKDITFLVSGFNGFGGAITVTINGLPTGVTSDLLRLRDQVWTLATGLGARPDSWHRRSPWFPHCTIARDIASADVPRVIPLLRDITRKAVGAGR